MTEEQNKLAERLDQLRNQLVMNRGLHIDDHQSFCAHLGEIIAARYYDDAAASGPKD